MTEIGKIDEETMRKVIKVYPNSVVAQAYRMGLKDKSLELAPEIEKLMKK